MKKLIAVICALCVIAFAAASAEGIMGQEIPDFTVSLTDGSSVTLSELLKEKELVVLNVFATWCGPCQAEFPEMEEAYQKYSDRIEIVAVSGAMDDTMEEVSAFREAFGLSFPMGMAGDAMDFLEADGFPTTVMIDRNGKAGAFRLGMFSSGEQFEAMLLPFLGEDYQEKLVVPVCVVDNKWQLVSGAQIRCCAGEACEVIETGDEGYGVLVMDPQETYQITILALPEGYSFDPEAEAKMDTYGNYVLYVTKDKPAEEEKAGS